MDEHGVVGEGEMEAVVTGSGGMPKHTNATQPRREPETARFLSAPQTSNDISSSEKTNSPS